MLLRGSFRFRNLCFEIIKGDSGRIFILWISDPYRKELTFATWLGWGHVLSLVSEGRGGKGGLITSWCYKLLGNNNWQAFLFFAAWTSSILLGVFCSLGHVMGAFLDRFGFRIAAIFGRLWGFARLELGPLASIIIVFYTAYRLRFAVDVSLVYVSSPLRGWNVNGARNGLQRRAQRHWKRGITTTKRGRWQRFSELLAFFSTIAKTIWKRNDKIKLHPSGTQRKIKKHIFLFSINCGEEASFNGHNFK